MTDDDALRLLEADEIRARRRPRAIFFVWLWELVCGVLIATPVHAWARAFFGAHPDGDELVFRPSGYWLMSWLDADSTALGVVTRSTLVAIVVASVLGTLVTGALVASLASGHGPEGRAPGAAPALRTGIASFFPLLGIGVAATALQAMILALGAGASSAVAGSLETSSGDARAFQARVAVFLPFIAFVLVVGVVADLARVAIARQACLERPRLQDGGLAALRAARGNLGRAFAAWGWRAALALALVAVGARAGDLTGARDGAALWLLFAVHQAIVLARAALRASWLARALRLVVTTTPT